MDKSSNHYKELQKLYWDNFNRSLLNAVIEKKIQKQELDNRERSNYFSYIASPKFYPKKNVNYFVNN